MDTLTNELASSFPDLTWTIRIVLRLLGAALFGAVVGYDRERSGKSAGLRTHMLVCISCAVFVIAPLEAGMSEDVGRVIQGVAAGIGFIGAGAILKRNSEAEIQGLTTAAGIWMTAAAGVAAGMGQLGLGAISVVLAWIILAVLGKIQPHDDH